jgi:hypothetical protein
MLMAPAVVQAERARRVRESPIRLAIESATKAARTAIESDRKTRLGSYVP